MNETGQVPEPLLVLPKNQVTAYGCLFCVTGKEKLVADNIERNSRHVQARAVCQTKRFTHKGNTTLQTEVVLHGYVMLKARKDLDIRHAIPDEGVITLLKYSDGDWRLCGDDEAYAKWVFRYDGIIGLSKAYQVGDRIQIIEGPLKDLEGCITRIDRRNRSGQVTLTFGGKEIKIWLGFEIIEKHSVNELKLSSFQTLPSQRSLFMQTISIVALSVLLFLFLLILWSCLHIHVRGGQRRPGKEVTPKCPRCQGTMWGISSGSHATGFTSKYVCEKCGWQTAPACSSNSDHALSSAYAELKAASSKVDV